jgi:aryl sulfotransferase
VPFRYRSDEEDSGRWADFQFREGDVVISTRSKSGTTWLQMICALLVFQTPDLPAPLPELSPWLDWLPLSRDEVFSRLRAQQHRRFIKTHTPLDGIPLDPCATYIVAARHPLDMAVSLYHQSANIDRGLLSQLTGQPEPNGKSPTRLPVREWLLQWIDDDVAPQEQLDSLRGVMWHLSSAWVRRSRPNVVLMHYNDLCTDLEGGMRHLADTLGIAVPDRTWPILVKAASFRSMRASAERLAPDPLGIFRNKAAFFRRGTSGAGREVLTSYELAHYLGRTTEMAPQALLTWLHRGNADQVIWPESASNGTEG